ncbi:MAG: neutral/alkaline non-lysosomal ceramidase N-terminal domain-containing protein [Clostridia bacterium]|nr:neutral/alkaline non-lysosomal ceramidase N-terminal domain-containing protein [Clostridia bacterium]
MARLDDALYLGAAREDITPKVGCALYGYRPDWFSDSLNDPLEAIAFYFKQGDTCALMITASLCLIKTSLYERIEKMITERFGIPAENIMIHATHTHSGPNVAGTVGWGDVDTEYVEGIMIPALMKVVEKAVADQTAVTMGIARGESLVGINRRQIDVNNRVILGQNPWGSFDPRMTVLSFKGTDGKIKANLIHYGAHGTASGMNKEISRDWMGVMTDKLTRITGGITAFFNGPEGDVGPRLTNGLTVGYKCAADAMELGAVAAQDAVRIFRDMGGYANAALSVSRKDIQIPLSPRPDKQTLEEKFGVYKNETVNINAAKGEYYRRIMGSYEAGYEDKPYRTLPQTVIRLGDVAFVSFPYELFSEIGMRIAQESKIPYVLSLSNTNGSEGYFVTEDQICRGGYEIEMFKTGYIQPYADNADWGVVTETLKHLSEVQSQL